MPLHNSEYDAVMRRYDEIREKHRHLQEERTEDAYRQIPELEDLDSRISVISLEAAKRRIQDPAADLGAYRTEMASIAERKKTLLTVNGLPEDYLELTCDCPLCHDTGYVDGVRCRCFDRIASGILYGDGSLSEIQKKSGLASFSFEPYSDTMTDRTGGRTDLENARAAYAAAKDAAGRIGSSGSSLYIYGNTGVGKTWLSQCVASEALQKGHSVLYFSAGDFFDTLVKSAYSGREGEDAAMRLIRRCDLLVLDDLGTETSTAFTVSAFFRVINSRLAEQKSTIISSNLSLRELSGKYSERVFSRIMDGYHIIRLTGNDIRLWRKRIDGTKRNE